MPPRPLLSRSSKPSDDRRPGWYGAHRGCDALGPTARTHSTPLSVPRPRSAVRHQTQERLGIIRRRQAPLASTQSSQASSPKLSQSMPGPPCQRMPGQGTHQHFREQARPLIATDPVRQLMAEHPTQSSEVVPSLRAGNTITGLWAQHQIAGQATPDETRRSGRSLSPSRRRAVSAARSIGSHAIGMARPTSRRPATNDTTSRPKQRPLTTHQSPAKTVRFGVAAIARNPFHK